MELKNEALKLNIQLNDSDINKFDLYYEFLVDYNQNVNLTAITEYDDVMIKHFYDSLILSKALPDTNITLLDVGAGAGFPSVPVGTPGPEPAGAGGLGRQRGGGRGMDGGGELPLCAAGPEAGPEAGAGRGALL